MTVARRSWCPEVGLGILFSSSDRFDLVCVAWTSGRFGFVLLHFLIQPPDTLVGRFQATDLSPSRFATHSFDAVRRVQRLNYEFAFGHFSSCGCGCGLRGDLEIPYRLDLVDPE